MTKLVLLPLNPVQVWWTVDQARFTPITTLQIPPKFARATTPPTRGGVFQAFVVTKPFNPNDFQVDFTRRTQVMGPDGNFLDATWTRGRMPPIPPVTARKDLLGNPTNYGFRVDTVDLTAPGFATVDVRAVSPTRLRGAGLIRPGPLIATVTVRAVAGVAGFSAPTVRSAILNIVMPPTVGPPTPIPKTPAPSPPAMITPLRPGLRIEV